MGLNSKTELSDRDIVRRRWKQFLVDMKIRIMRQRRNDGEFRDGGFRDD